ncbi:unnamed protein product, partial [Pylaiella littoralis]
KQPSYGVASGTRTVCSRHAAEGTAQLSTFKAVSGVHGRSGGARGGGGLGPDLGIIHSAGDAGGKRKYRSPVSLQTGTSAGTTRVDNKRFRQAPSYATISPAP